MKKIIKVDTAPSRHWVGDGFPVRSYFSYQNGSDRLSPFLLLDHAGPETFAPTDQPRGVGAHPHRGFETVTIVYAGEVAHRDSAGGGGIIGPGDVQWMTAGAGIVHEEFHSPGFTRTGGDLEMVQLWVNLPAEEKQAAPGYQAIHDKDIPRVAMPDESGTLRVIAGSFADASGPARTHSPLNVWDLHLQPAHQAELSVPDGHNLMVVVLHGRVELNRAETLRGGEVAILDRAGSQFCLNAVEATRLLVLSGEPLDEPVVGHGPFVMNSEEEIREAIDDYNAGRFNVG